MDAPPVDSPIGLEITGVIGGTPSSAISDYESDHVWEHGRGP